MLICRGSTPNSLNRIYLPHFTRHLAHSAPPCSIHYNCPALPTHPSTRRRCRSLRPKHSTRRVLHDRCRAKRLIQLQSPTMGRSPGNEATVHFPDHISRTSKSLRLLQPHGLILCLCVVDPSSLCLWMSVLWKRLLLHCAILCQTNPPSSLIPHTSSPLLLSFPLTTAEASRT